MSETEYKKLLQEIFDLMDGPWCDPVISEELYNKIEKALK